MKYFFIILTLLLLSSACAESQKHHPLQQAKRESMVITGKVHMLGGGRMSRLSITDSTSGISYTIANPSSFALDSKQNQTIQLTAKLLKKAVGPGFPAVVEVLSIKN